MRLRGLCQKAASSVQTNEVVGETVVTSTRVKQGQDSSSRICNHSWVPRRPREAEKGAETKVNATRKRPGGVNKSRVTAEDCRRLRQSRLAQLSTVWHSGNNKGVPLFASHTDRRRVADYRSAEADLLHDFLPCVVPDLFGTGPSPGAMGGLESVGAATNSDAKIGAPFLH